MSNINTPNTETNSLENQLGTNSPDGEMIGQAATDKVGFYGVGPVVQQTGNTVVNTTGMNSGTSGLYSTTTLNAAFITAVANIQTALKNLGLSS